MPSFSTTELNAVRDIKWDRSLEDARYANGVFLNRIANKSAQVKESGQQINVTIKQRYTVGNVGSNGAFVPQTWNAQSVALTIDQNKQVAIETEGIAKAQSFWDPDSDIPKDAGAAYAEHYDNVIAGQYTAFTSLTPVSNVENPAAFGKNQMKTALLRLADANVPKSDLSFFLPPIAFYGGLLDEVQFTAADQSGQPKNVLTTGYQFTLLGIPFYLSTTIPTAGSTNQSRVGLCLHKSAMAIAFQQNNEIRRSDRTAALVDSFVVLIKSLYGIKVIRADHGVQINVAAA